MIAARTLDHANPLQIALTERLDAGRASEARPEPRWLSEDDINRFRNVLAYVDSSTAATEVVAWGIRMARANSAGLDVVHYIADHDKLELEPRAAPMSRGIAADSLGAEALNLRDAVLTARQLTGMEDGPAVPPPHVHVRRGGVPSSLIEEVREYSANLLILEADDLLEPHGRAAAILQHGLRVSGLSILLVRATIAAKLNRVTACVDFTPSAWFATSQALSLAHAFGAALRLLHPYHLRSLDLQGLACAPERSHEHELEYERRFTARFRQWLPPWALDLEDLQLVCRDVPNWDYESGLTCALDGECADLFVLPLRPQWILAGLRGAALIRRVASAVAGSLLIVRS